MPAQQQFNGPPNSRGPIPFNNMNNNALLPDLATLITQRPPLGFSAPPNHQMFMNQVQPRPNVFVPNFSPLPNQFQHQQQQYNLQNAILPHQLQALNSLLTMQMSPQFAPYNVLAGNHQMACPQNPNIIPNALLALNLNQQNIAVPTLPLGVNAPNPLPMASQQLQGNTFLPDQPSHSTQSQPSHSMQSPSFNRNLGNRKNHGQTGNQHSTWKNDRAKDFKHYNKRPGSQSGCQNSPYRHNNNKKRKFGLSHEKWGKGQDHKQTPGFRHTVQTMQDSGKKRSLAISYTEQEIKQWREQRRKNYPSKANIEKKQNEELNDSEVIDREAKLRREQLKDILRKQAELEVEVAELPPQYLSDSEKKVCRKKDTGTPLNKKGKFLNKFNKRGRHNRNSKGANHRNLSERVSPEGSSFPKRQPTLLQKLLSADIRRDNHRLLQVFRFFVMNSFLEDWPKKPLKFPLVVVKEDGFEVSSLQAKDASRLSTGTSAVKFSDLGDNNDRADEDVDQVQGGLGRGKGSLLIEEVNEGEEEGEITD